ncbi:MAG: hypothetical protein ACOC1P_03125 [Minisyncoccales bacterium]
MKCQVLGCKNEAEHFMRTKNVCRKCYKILHKDNRVRISMGKTIPKSFKLVKLKLKKRGYLNVDEEKFNKIGELNYNKIK